MTENIITDPQTVPYFTLATGEHIPAIGMGTFGSDHFEMADISAAVAGAIDCGYRLFDCASVYGNEDLIGDVFQAAFDQGTVKREDLFIMSKVWNDQHRDVIGAIEKSLKDLHLDYLDAYFMHWPFPNYHARFATADDRNPDSIPFSLSEFMDTWYQLEMAQKRGLIRNLGMSSMTIPKLEAVLPLCTVKPTLIELEHHPAFQQPGLFKYLKDHGITMIGFCPLGSPTRPERDKTPNDVVDMKMPELVAIAKAHNVHPALVCLKWAVQRGVIPIPFSIYPAEYQSNLRSVTEDPLTAEEMNIMASINKNDRFIKGEVFLWQGSVDWRDLWDEEGVITAGPTFPLD
ncbi:aldo/keto reductase [Lacticaseibacillus baoqingensis]|uniref:Aldo/keto reductase n=1 Tax=Lacticaseibacillus baoqingensis TaxID=2486013 RepID=A0ABW4E5F8_9LACO|nr:aldo/keto reductase [Lacticaseibacillus baoqingensis]